MAALLSVWMSLACLLLALGMVVYRPMFSDLMLVVELYFGIPGTLCLAGLVLWAYRKDTGDDPGLAMRRLQCRVAIGLSLAAAAIVYVLVILAAPVAVGGSGVS